MIEQAFAIGVDVALKATILLVLAFAFDRALGAGRILIRSAMWNACLLALLALPVATMVFPRLRIDTLPSSVSAVPVETAPLTRPEAYPARPGSFFYTLLDWYEQTVTQPGTRRSSVEPAAAGPAAAGPTDHNRSVDWVAIAMCAYALGAILLLARFVGSVVAVRRLRLSSRPLITPSWTHVLERWRQRLTIRQPVSLATTEDVNVPVAMGCARPAILLPAALTERLSPAQQEAVLLHELAHIRRADYAWQLLHRVVQLLFWPHPLIWLTRRPIAAVRERACDDLCVHHLASAQVYRATLVELASALVRRPSVSLGIAMARTPRIAQRLERIDRGCRASRCLSRSSVRTVIVLLSMMVVGGLAPIELSRRTTLANDRTPDDALLDEAILADSPAGDANVRAAPAASPPDRGASPSQTREPQAAIVRQLDIPKEAAHTLVYAHRFASAGDKVVYSRDRYRSLAVTHLATGHTTSLDLGVPSDTPELFAYTPVWSPEGDRVAFVIYWKDQAPLVRIVPASGGQPQTPFKVPDGVPWLEDWSRDGKWLLLSVGREDNTTSLMMIPVDGGETKQLVTLDWGEWDDLGHRLSPDGNLVAYSRQRDGRSALFIYSLESGRQIPVAPSPHPDSQPRWSADGRYLLFKSNRAGSFDLWAQPISDGAPRGEPFVVKKGLGGGAILSGVLNDGRLLYWAKGKGRRRGGGAYRVAIDPDTGQPTGKPMPVNRAQALSVGRLRASASPDGRVAFGELQYGTGLAGRIGLRVVSADGKNVRAVPTGLRNPQPLGWLADGTSLLASGFDNTGKLGLHRLDTATGEIQTLMTSPHFDFRGYKGHFPGPPRLSPDGRQVLFSIPFEGVEANTTALYLINTKADAKPVLLRHDAAEHSSTNPGWSPDGKSIALVARNEKARESRILVIPASGGKVEELVRHKGDLWSPAWSPDSKSIVFAAGKDFASKPWFISEKAKSCRLLVIPANGGESKELARHEGSLRSPAWSPDGRFIAYRRGTFASGSGLWMVRANGTKPVHLASLDSYKPRRFRWGADGKTLLFMSTGERELQRLWALENFLPADSK